MVCKVSYHFIAKILANRLHTVLLTELLQDEVDNGNYILHQKCKNLVIMNLQFANDVVILCYANEKIMHSISRVLEKFVENLASKLTSQNPVCILPLALRRCMLNLQA